MHEHTRSEPFNDDLPSRRRSALALASVTLALGIAILVPGTGGGLGAQTVTLPPTTCVGVTVPIVTPTSAGDTTTTSLFCTALPTSTTANPTTTSTAPASTTTSTAPASTTTTTSGATTTSSSTSSTSTTVGGVLRLSSSTVTPGQRVTLAGDRLPANATLQMNFLSAPVSLGSVTTSATGSFQATITIPTDAVAGTHQINVTDAGGRVLATVDLTVNRPTAGRGGLARTGANAVGVAFLAATVSLLGWAILSSNGALSRRRWQ